MASKYKKHSDKEHWLNEKWRPAMGWMYLIVCVFDFIFAPILWSMIQAYFKGTISSQWQPLTLQGGGLFHMSMGAIVGISAYGRTQEKINGVSFQGLGTTYVPPGQGTVNVNNQPNISNSGYGYSRYNNPSYDNVAPVVSPHVLIGHAGKKAPMLPDDPVL